MEPTSYLFEIPEIEAIIIGYLDPIKDYKKLILINKYFYGIISSDKTYSELKNLSSKREFWLNYYAFKNLILNQIFITSCDHGYLHAAKYIYDNYHEKINIHVSSEYLFRWSCRDGRIETVKFLLSLDNKMDIHADNDCAFVWSCEKGHLQIAKLIYSLDPNIDIHVRNNYAFEWSLKNNHYGVHDWLKSLRR